LAKQGVGGLALHTDAHGANSWREKDHISVPLNVLG